MSDQILPVIPLMESVIPIDKVEVIFERREVLVQSRQPDVLCLLRHKLVKWAVLQMCGYDTERGQHPVVYWTRGDTKMPLL